MQEFYFLARHTPFWSIPITILGLEFAYVYWIRQKKSSVVLCLGIAFFGMLCTGFYIWAGGPDKTVRTLIRMHRMDK